MSNEEILELKNKTPFYAFQYDLYNLWVNGEISREQFVTYSDDI